MARSEGSKKSSGPAVWIGLGIVTAVLLIPAVAWTRESARLYTMDLEGAFLWVYLPARLLALLGLVLMFFQAVLAARFPFMEKLYKRSSLLKTHRTTGKVAYIMILLHGIGILAFDLISAGEIYLYTEKTVGLIALILLTFAVLAAWFFKPLKLSLNQWRRIHLLTYIVFPLVIWHALVIGSTVNAVPSLRALLIVLLAGYILVGLYRILRLVRTRAA